MGVFKHCELEITLKLKERFLEILHEKEINLSKFWQMAVELGKFEIELA